MFYDVIIIGSGPAGLTAAIYAERAGLKVMILEKFIVGGQVVITYEIENYPGFINISGVELINKMEEQVKNFNIEIKNEEVVGLNLEGNIKSVITNNNKYECTCVILTMGASPKFLGVKGEEEFRAKGVSYCATCDGGFFRKKDVVVVGGGNTAVEDSIFLSRLCKKVYLVHRRDAFRANKKLVEALLQINNVEILYDSIVNEIYGDKVVNGVVVNNLKTNEVKKISADGVFIAIGVKPSNQIVEGIVQLDDFGFIITDAYMATNVSGVFAAGDGRVTPLKQIITAASDGAVAAYSASAYIASL